MEKFKPEKFDPSNPEYKKVEDLPLEVQDNFMDVKGGFVRKSVVEYEQENMKDVLNSENVLDKVRAQIEGVLVGDAKTRRKRVLGIIMADATSFNNSEGIEKVSYENKNAEYVDKVYFIKKAIETYFQNLEMQEIAKLLNPMQEAMRKIGHEGQLFKESCRRDGCSRLFGDLDGKNIDVHTNTYGNIGSDRVSSEESEELINKYWGIAVNREEYNRVRRSCSEGNMVFMEVVLGAEYGKSSLGDIWSRQQVVYNALDFNNKDLGFFGDEVEELWSEIVNIRTARGLEIKRATEDESARTAEQKRQRI